MFENSKMFYFIKLMFLHLEEEKKLDMFRYNKGLKKKFDISLINYQIYSNNYTIYDESKVKGKEYDKL